MLFNFFKLEMIEDRGNDEHADSIWSQCRIKVLQKQFNLLVLRKKIIEMTKVRSKNVKAKIQPTADFKRSGKKHTKGN